MACMTCTFCKQYMSNNMDVVYFSYDCFSDALYNEKVEECKNGLDEYFYLFPDEIPEIWRCPKCKAVYWFEFQNNKGVAFTLKDTIPLNEYQDSYNCECGHHFNRDELIHCFPDEQRISIVSRIDEAVTKQLPTEFEDSRVHVWKCPDCNHLYWIERDTGLVYQYVHKNLKEK